MDAAADPVAAVEPGTGPDLRAADFRSLAETLSSLIALIRDNRIVYVNPAACALLGRPREWFRDRHLADVVHPDDRDAALARGRARSAGVPQPKRIVERLVHADGRTIWMDYSIDVVRFEGHQCTLVTGHDVTERRRIEERLRASEQRLAEAQRIAHVGSWEWDVGQDRIAWSEEMCRIFGATPDTFGGSLSGYLDRIHPDDRATARIVLEQSLECGGSFAFEHRIVRPDGQVRSIYGRGEVFRDASGRANRVAGTGQDISERKRMESDLQRSEERFRLAFTHAAIGKAILAPDGRILQVNPAASAILGRSEGDLLQLDHEAITHPADRAKKDAFVADLLRGPNVAAALEQRLLHNDGETVWCRLNATLVRDHANAPQYFIVEFEDVTERRRAEEGLRESEERFRNLCTQAPVMLMSFDPDGRVRDVSDFWLQTTGFARREVVGQDGFRFLTAESRDRLLQAIEENQRNDEVVIRNFPMQVLCKDGRALDLLSTSVAERDDAGEPRGAICVQINVTDLQRAEAALRESAERYRALVEHAPEAIMVLDVDLDRFVDANAHAERLFGYPRQKLLTMGPLDFCPEHQADRRASCEVVEDEHRKVLAGATSVFEFTHVDANGREISCQTRLSALPAAGRRLIRATITDITELKQLQEKVRHAEKLAAVGMLAAGVAHEIGNPLMALSMAAQNLERRACDDYSQQKLTLIREHIDRIARIVRQMSDLARPPSGRRVRCDVNQIVHRAIEMVRYDQRARSTEIRFALAETLPAVEVVEDELMQVCINLALNAFDAMADNDAATPRHLSVESMATEGRIRVTFRDSGPGVPAEIRPRLFEPFFTTKQAGRGSGLGLSVSYRILDEHGGALRLDTTAERGAAFVFELPIGATV